MALHIHVQKDIELSREDVEQLIKEKKAVLEEIGKTIKGSEYIHELSELAQLQLEINDFEEAEKNYQVCLKHFELQKDPLGQAAVYGLLGTLYLKKKEYIDAIKYYKKAYHIYNERNQFQESIICLMGIGNSNVDLEQLDDACEIFLECSQKCSDSNDLYGLLDCLGNLILIHEKLERWDVVFELYKKTLKAFKQIEDSQGVITCYFNLGLLMKKAENLEEALRYFQKGTNVAIEVNYAEYIIKGLSYVAENLFYQGKMREAKDQLVKALYLATNSKYDNAIIQINVLLKSLGLSEDQIQKELEEYKESRILTE